MSDDRSAQLVARVRAGDEQAAQEAPEAIEQQRIPKAAREMAKGYFRNLSAPREPAKQEGAKP